MDLTFATVKLIGVVLRPSNAFLILFLIGTLFLYFGRPSMARWILGATVLGLTAITCLPVGYWLLNPLEERFPAMSTEPDGVDGIVVLGGAVRAALSADRGQPELNGRAERMTEFVALARRYPNARLVFTGGTAALFPTGKTTEATIARDLFQAMGLDVQSVEFEQTARNTYENAVMTKAAVNPAPGQTWLLVTSAAHMPRAVGVFRRVGWPVLPWPVDYMTGDHPRAAWPNVGRALVTLDLAAHEWQGLVGYHLMGYTQHVFPSPDDQRASPGPSLAPVRAALSAPVPPTPSNTVTVCKTGCDHTTLAAALNAARDGDTVSVGAGLYTDGGVIRANDLTLTADSGAHLRGGAVEGKAALVIKGDNALIEGLECSAITVRDRNGACIRLEGHTLTVRHVYFHDSQQGVLANAGSGDIVIEDSRFERLGEGGRAHGIYVNTADSLTIRRTEVISTRGQGHAVKSRAARTVIEDSVLAGLNGQDSRLIDVSNGGSLIVRNCVLQKGPNSDNREAIGFGLEGLLYPSHSLLIEETTLIMDRTPNRLTRTVVPGTWKGGRIIGAEGDAISRLTGRMVDMIVPRHGGDALSFEGDVQWFPDREAAGLEPFPALPAVPERGPGQPRE